MRVYKLLNDAMQSHGETSWVLGEPHTAPGTGALCTAGWLHYYEHPLLAVLLNSLDGNIAEPRLFSGEASAPFKFDVGLKGGCATLVLTEELRVPVPSLATYVHFGLLCAQRVTKDSRWNTWAHNWLTRQDRTYTTAKAQAVTWAERAERADAVVLARPEAVAAVKLEAVAAASETATWAETAAGAAGAVTAAVAVTAARTDGPTPLIAYAEQAFLAEEGQAFSEVSLSFQEPTIEE